MSAVEVAAVVVVVVVVLRLMHYVVCDTFLIGGTVPNHDPSPHYPRFTLSTPPLPSPPSYNDTHVGEAIRDIFAPLQGQSVRDCVGSLLGAEGNPKETLRTLAGLTAQLCIEFEKEGASSRLRGSPLVGITIKILQKMHGLWNPGETAAATAAAAGGGGGGAIASTPAASAGAAHGGGGGGGLGCMGNGGPDASTTAATTAANTAGNTGGAGQPSFTGTMLEALAATAAAATPMAATTCSTCSSVSARTAAWLGEVTRPLG